MRIESHRDLIVWRESIYMVVSIYQLASAFPNTERSV
jgi:hypothetical protein